MLARVYSSNFIVSREFHTRPCVSFRVREPVEQQWPVSLLLRQRHCHAILVLARTYYNRARGPGDSWFFIRRAAKGEEYPQGCLANKPAACYALCHPEICRVRMLAHILVLRGFLAGFVSDAKAWRT